MASGSVRTKERLKGAGEELVRSEKEREVLQVRVEEMGRGVKEAVRKKDEVEELRRGKERELEEALASARAELGRLATEKRRAEEEKSLADNRLKELMQENNLVVARLKEIDETRRKKDEEDRVRGAKESEMEKALASAKAELGRLASEKIRVEENMSLCDKKFNDVLQEKEKLVANLEKEIEESRRKKDELEKRWKANDSEMEEALASAKTELDFTKMEKRRVEEEKSKADEFLKGFMMENNLVVANLNMEIDELKRKMVELEKTTKARQLEMKEKLASAAVEIDRLEMEKRRVEEEKSLCEKKLKDFMQENGLVVANLKKEIDDMTRKEEELEKRWKAKESEMEEALATTKAEMDFAKMEKRRAEEDRSLADKKVETLVFQNNMVVVKLKNELDELTRRKDELEEISKAKEVQVSELKISYDNLLKEIQILQGELQKENHEKMERESFFSIRQEEMTKCMDDLNRKLKEAMEEKRKVEDVEHNQELKIAELEGEAKELKKTLSDSEKLGGDRAEKILRLQAEKVALEEAIVQQNEKEKCLDSEIEELQKYKHGLEKETEHLKEIVAASEKSGKDAANEISRLNDENGTLQKSIVEHNEKEKHLELEIFSLKEIIGTFQKKVEDFKLLESSLLRSEKHQGEQISFLQEERNEIHRRYFEELEKGKILMLQLTESRDANDVLAKEVKNLKHKLSCIEKTETHEGEESFRIEYLVDDNEEKLQLQQKNVKSPAVEANTPPEKKDSSENLPGGKQEIRTVENVQAGMYKEMKTEKYENNSAAEDFKTSPQC